MKEIFKRLKNKGTIVAVISSVLMILANLGFTIDNEGVMIIINSICAIGISLGVMNDPTTKGIDNIAKDKNDKEV